MIMCCVSVLYILAMALLCSASAAQCPPEGFSTVQNFNLENFVSRRWYIQEQMQVGAVPRNAHRCIHADYKLLPKKSFWGYDIQVLNHAVDDAPPYGVHDTGSFLCAKIVDGSAGKLVVAPCALPPRLAGPFWVIDYDESVGYAIISGGPPTEVHPGGCRTGSGVNNAGLWIFTREQQPGDDFVKRIRLLAENKGFDTSVLERANQSSCEEFDARETIFQV